MHEIFVAQQSIAKYKITGEEWTRENQQTNKEDEKQSNKEKLEKKLERTSMESQRSSEVRN
jgi:hypothetical protein